MLIGSTPYRNVLGGVSLSSGVHNPSQGKNYFVALSINFEELRLQKIKFFGKFLNKWTLICPLLRKLDQPDPPPGFERLGAK
jgi:hypothetical protein